MQTSNAFTIYNASAGSGKTYTLVKAYLKLILRHRKEDFYKNLLAITFTNKAVGEMKQRIINALVSFSDPEVIANPPKMLSEIAEENQQQIVEIHLLAKKIVKHILHHYAGFTIETIDRFSHQLIRTFARDLKLPQNFEVTLEAPSLIVEAVDRLIMKAGEDAEITKVLIDFALEKIDDDTSWDISRDIVNAAELILNENDAYHLSLLKNKTLKDFTDFKKQLLKQKESLLTKIQEIASRTLQIIDDKGLQHSDFSRSLLPTHFEKLSSGNIHINYGAKWQESLTENKLYPAKVDSATADIIDALAPQLAADFDSTKKLVYQCKLIDSISKNITPLSVINLVKQELEDLKIERSLLLISEFNSIINEEIKNQPVPFIYERLGEKYQHFFIDEFQDTSLMQWQNLIPLIDNAISQESHDGTKGSLLLVGDAKQSIYRWRGGLPEQFMKLYGFENPFSIESSEKEVINLETNWRSCSEIIDFNNAFFAFVSSKFGNRDHYNLYFDGNQQKCTTKDGGYVKIEFIEYANSSEAHEFYAAKVYETVLSLRESGYSFKEICILTRTRIEGTNIGAFLVEKEIPILSSETLLISNSTIVQCIIDTITLCIDPENQKIRVRLLEFLYDQFQITIEKHTFLNSFLDISIEDFEIQLKSFGIEFSFSELFSVSLYESCEYCIRKFQLDKDADGYLFSFLDVVFEFQQQVQASKISFLEHWDSIQDRASIVASEGADAVQIMTIHKSKGLEFPVVIYPYADISMHNDRFAKVWFPYEDPNTTFNEVYINFNKDVEHYGDTGAGIYKERKETVELDNINLLYVTLTRAVEQLYVFAKKPKDTSSADSATFNQILGEFLKQSGNWNEETLISEFGFFQKPSLPVATTGVQQISPNYITSAPEDHNLKIISTESSLWETTAEEAIAIGNLLHHTMALIKTEADVNSIYEEMVARGAFSKKDIISLFKTINLVVTHPELNHLFQSRAKVMTERSIFTRKGEVLRPDRLNFHAERSVSIIDYKSGSQSESHARQINEYAAALEEMNFSVSEKILVYTTDHKIMINKI